MHPQIRLENIGRRFNRDWIFRSLNYTFQPGTATAILGPNGSGKSTLLQVIAGSLTPSEGAVHYTGPSAAVDPDQVYRQVSFAAPYIELIEELTLREHIDFHFSFKDYGEDLDAAGVMELLNIPFADKQIRHFSSGMKQRTRLALAFCANSPVVLLDEPTSNLDQQGVTWYNQMIDRFAAGKTVIIGSNQEHEVVSCTQRLLVTDYK